MNPEEWIKLLVEAGDQLANEVANDAPWEVLWPLILAWRGASTACVYEMRTP